MIGYVTHKPGQSIYDLCLQTYGTLDMLVRFCNENGVTDMGSIPQQVQYQYEKDLVKYEGNKKEYATELARPTTCAIITGLTNTDLTGTSATFEWDVSSGTGYQYAYNTTGTTPDTWITTGSTVRVLTGLEGDTEYFFFVRNVCAPGVYSTPVSLSVTTDEVAPVLPVTSGLILSLFSSYGVETTGSDVTKWNDLSGLANHLLPVTGNAQKVAAVFGTRPAIAIDDNDMETVGNMVGLSGDAACTCFIVSKYANPVASIQMLYYSAAPGGIATGEFETYVYDAVLGLSANMKGDVGFNVGYNTSAADTAHVNTIVMNFAAASGSELIIKKDDSAADFVSLVASENTNTFIAAPVGVGLCEAEIGCIVMYDRVLTGGEQTSVVNYLTTYFGL